MATNKGIYKISIDNQIYIGKSTNIPNRWQSYFTLKCKSQPLLYDSLIRHGVQAHRFEVQEECEDSNIKELSEKEIFWYNYYKSNGYTMLNSTTPALQEKMRQLYNGKIKELNQCCEITKKCRDMYDKLSFKDFFNRLLKLSEAGVKVVYAKEFDSLVLWFPGIKYPVTILVNSGDNRRFLQILTIINHGQTK